MDTYGGYDASISQFPWYAHIDGYSGSELIKPCGGTIISPSFVMTEAFCGTGPTSYHLYFGNTNFSSENENPQISNVFIRHPLFNSPSWLSNNIALIQLSTPITFSISMFKRLLFHGSRLMKLQFIHFLLELGS